MTIHCSLCDDTGSLSKDIEGQLDCGACDVALQRVALENWAVEQKLECSVSALWVIYQKGVQAGKRGAADLTDAQIYALAEQHDAVVVCSGEGDYNANCETIVKFARALLAKP